MGWRCLDCGNKASKKFHAGRCPACDSFNIQGKSSKAKDPTERSERRKKIDIVVLVVCWGSLGLLLVTKMF
jgi:predicted ATP-dependent serine protease|tara:strand:+ start:1845 stop:2057 length:213 start_codon:yes stop_codon:yes gene_type:complete